MNSSKTSLYPEKIPTIRPKNQESSTEASAKAFLDNESNFDGSATSSSTTSSTTASDIPQIANILHQETMTATTKNDVDSGMKVVSSKPRTKPAVSEPPASSTSSSSSKEENEDETISEEDAIAMAAAFSGPKVPVVVCKHREAVTLGDFENNKPAVQYNRPTDLVYEIQLPLASAPSKIILDVSEK